MPYTNLIQNCLKVRLKASQFLSTMSTSLQFCPNRFHFETNPLLYRSSQSVIPQKRCLHGSVGFFCSAKGSSSSSSSSSVVLRRKRRGSSSSSSYPSPYFYQQNLGYGRFAYDECESESESDRETQSSKQLGESTLHNIEEWRWKLSMLMRKKDDQEVVSTDKKDRRDFEHISALATRMGLHCRQYEKTIVCSKVPLPNYRPDLDVKRPQREVVLHYGLQSRVGDLLEAHLSKKSVNKENLTHNASLRGSNDNNSPNDKELHENEKPFARNVVAERILMRRSLEMHNKQGDWQGSPEGQKMLELRRNLPAYKEREALLRAISENQVVVVSGETGCGKTTQLPQYILEAEIEAARGATCNIICTQPRRISAMSVAERVAAERGENLGESVGYKVRLEGMRGRDTRLLFCTTGILLRRLLVDRKLEGVTHVIVDEIHERGMNEDFLLIVLKDLLPRRPELRLILMSATLNAELFSSYYGGAPMIHIPGFTHPVRSHFLENILEMTRYRLTPYNQIDNYGQDKMWKMQKQTIRKRKTQIASAVEESLESADFGQYNPLTRDSLSCWNPDSIGFNLIEHVLCHICRNERPGAVLVFMTGWDDINTVKDQLQAHPLLGDPSRVLLLACHGSMASAEQKLIFDKPEDGIRKIVLATNMAETSITINDVVFVVDCGKAKETSYDAINNTPCLLPSWISKASARQRKGRAGRVQPGECYHLYPRCVYEAFADYQLPELLRTPLQSLCLQIKSLQLGSISDFLSKAIQSPEPLSVQNAIEYLKTIGALDEDENLTVLGHNLSMLPVEPKLGKMIILGVVFNCLDPVLTVVAGLSARDPFLMPFDKKDLAESAKAQFSARNFSDHLALVRAYDGWKDAERQQSGYDYCWRNFLSAQTLKAMDSLRKQFLYLLKDIGLVDSIQSCNAWSNNEHLVRAIVCGGLFPGICSVVNKEKSISLKTMEDGGVLLYSNSVNAQEPQIPYPWLVFNEKVKVNSVFLRDSTAVSDSVVLLFGGSISGKALDGHLMMLGGYLEFFMNPSLANTYISLKRELNELVHKKDGHLMMLGGYLEFFMNPSLANTYISLKRELNELVHKKLSDRNFDVGSHGELLEAVKLLVSEDQCEGKFVNGRKPSPKKSAKELQKNVISTKGSGGENPKSHLQTLLARAGHQSPSYKITQLKNNKFRATVIFNGLNFAGQPSSSKKEAEKDAAAEALQWLTGETQSSSKVVEHMSALLKKSKSKNQLHSTKWR